MTIAIPDPRTWGEVVELADRLREQSLPPPAERHAIRKDSGATIEEVAAALGVNPMTVRRWEMGVSKPWQRHRGPYVVLLAALKPIAVERRRQAELTQE